MPRARAHPLGRFASLVGGLRLIPADWKSAASAIIASVLAVTAFILLLDGVLFRRSLPPDYVAFYTSALVPRMFHACVGSAIEEVEFRLILMTLLVAAVSRWKTPPPTLAFLAMILISQFANVWGLVLAYPPYASFRLWAVGCVWGWLYWRQGWLAALIAHAATHLLLDPLLAWVLIHTNF